MNYYNPLDAVPICSVSPEFKPSKGARFNYLEPGVKTSNSVAGQSDSEPTRKKQSHKKKSSSAKSTAAETSQKKNPNKAPDDPRYDFSQVPPPFCSCTGIARRCYKYGPGGWQSTCCTTSMSEYPLPMNPSRPGRRFSGRRMKAGAYTKILIKLASKANDLSYPVDLKNHWGKARQ
ncbi:hypothetical protein Leryth_026957 [Lithospermum erythrorhizon]|nr:hypothetical protein Leryth_026957 [Lithospermum erythrorhizon]